MIGLTYLSLIQIHLHGVGQINHLGAGNSRVRGAQKSFGGGFAVVVASQDQPAWGLGVEGSDDVVEVDLPDDGVGFSEGVDLHVPTEPLHLSDDVLKISKERRTVIS